MEYLMPQERDDVYDIVEWAAAQEWCDGKFG
jgi:predicted acyl esterase